MLSSWAKVIGELLEGGNAFIKDALKPAIEKVRDIRFADLKAWRKYNEEAEKRAESRKEKLNEIVNEADKHTDSGRNS